MKKELLVGIVFVIAVCLTAFGTIVVSGLSVFKPTTSWHVDIKEIAGLQTGDDVRVLGHRMGVVRRIDFDQQTYSFRLKLQMDADAPIHEGYKITIREASALGGTYLAVEPGTPAAPQADVRQLHGTAPLPGGPMAGLTDVLSELKTAVSAVTQAKGTVGKLIMQDDLYRDISDTTETLKTIAHRIETGQGTIGKLVNDDAPFVQLNSLLEKLNSGNSALAKLMRDDSGAIVDDLRTAAANVRSITGKIDDGTGSLGLLVNDPKLYEHAAGVLLDIRQSRGIVGMLISDEKARQNTSLTLENFASITTTLRDGRGTIGQLLTKDDVYNNINSISQHLNSASAKIDNGTGTIGKLINDPVLYDNVKRLVTRAIDAIENARDSAPVSAITSFIFGPFQ